MKDKIGVYIHIPFCKSKCYYCDFNSSSKHFDKVESYIGYLKKEMGLYSDAIRKYGIGTVFIGGGTPTAVDSSYIKDILKELYEANENREIEEITIEGNPATFTDRKVKDYRDAKINRFSMGVQSFDEAILKKIGRSHSESDIYESVKLLKENGAENINLDIMFGLPDQSYEDVLDTVEKAIALDIAHISYYSLKLEEGTLLYDLEKKGELEFSDEDEERKMYHDIREKLRSSGYEQYEISNFSKPGYECIHNIGYWKLKPYIGLGLSAASNIEGKRYSNADSFEDYYKLIDLGDKPIDSESVEIIDSVMERAEYVILGLRLTEGIFFEEFKARFGQNINCFYGETIEKYTELGILEKSEKRIRLTEKGLDFSNELFSEILP